MATLPEPVGPLVDEHGTETPDESVTVQLTVPVGVGPDPVTVAVKIKVPPVEMLEALSATDTVGTTCATVSTSPAVPHVLVDGPLLASPE